MADDPPQFLRPGFKTGTGFPSFFLDRPTVGSWFPADEGNFPKTATLTEDFSAPLDTTKWTPFGAGVSVSGGRLQIAGNAADVIETVGYYDLTGSSLSGEFVAAPSASLVNTQMDFGFAHPYMAANHNQAVFIWFASTLYMRLRTAGATSDATLAFDPVAHRFVRISESGGTISWDTSPDGISWTNRRAVASTWDLTAGSVAFDVQQFAAETYTATFDNVNLIPSATSVVLPSGPMRRGVRPPMARRRTQAARIPTQVVANAPAYVPESRRRAPRGFFARRRQQAALIPAQVVATPATFVPESRRRGPRAVMARWRRSNATRVPFSYPKTATLTDDFTTGVLDPKWTTLGGVAFSSGHLDIPVTASYNFITSTNLYDLTGSSLSAEFVQVPDAAATSTEMYLGFEQVSIGAVRVEWFNNTLLMRLRLGAVNDDTSIAYDPAGHRFVRIREAGGTIFWDTSPDGAVWTNRRTAAATFDLAYGNPTLVSGTFAADSSRDAIFDNVNLTPALMLLSRQFRRAVRPPVARRRGRTEVIPLQIVVTPPAKVADARRAVRRFAFLPRRDRSVEVVPPQTMVAPPATSRRTVGRFSVARRDRSVEVVSPQTQPPQAGQRRGVRGFVTRRRGRVEVVPPQIVVTPPTYAPDTRRRITRGFASRRRRSVEVVPPQIVVTPPAKVSDTRRAVRRIALLPRRDRSVEVTPPQVVAAAPRFVPTVSPKRALRGVPRRGRRADVPPAQAQAPRVQGRRPLRGLVRKVRRALGVIGSGAPTAPLVAQVILTAEIYPRTLTASLDDGSSGRFAGPAVHVLTAETYPRTLNADIID